MPVTYEKADKAVDEIVESMLKAHHPDLRETNAQVHAYFAIPEQNEDGESSTPAVKEYGAARAARVKINSTRDRVEGKPDATIYIDRSEWNDMEPAERDALIDGMLQRLQQVRDPSDPKIAKLDDLGRPRLKRRAPDFHFIGYNAVAQRHGENSGEVRETKEFFDKGGQHYFFWLDPQKHSGEQLAFGSGSAIDKVDDGAKFADGPRAKKFHTPADLQLKPGDLATACHPALVSIATKGTHPELRQVLNLGAMKYVVTPPPAGQPEDVYALRPLHNKATGEPSTADPYCGMKVLLEGQGGLQEFFIGAEGELLLAKDVDEPASPTAAIDADKAAKGRSRKKVKAVA